MTHELKIQKFLRAGGTLQQLEEKLVKHRRHGKHSNLVLLKYGIMTNFSDPLVQECRGLVLDEADDWKVVCHAFDKFFNHGEGHAAPIDWSSARVQEKLDGSLCTLYHYKGEWHVATTGTPDACGEVHDAGGTFADYFWQTFKEEGGETPDPGVGEDYCFSFELMGPANRIVVVHDKPWMRLLAVRDRSTGEQFQPEYFSAAIGIRPVRSFPLGSFEEIAASFETISPVSQEGYVVVDAKYNRVKVKHPGYVALHHAKDGMGPKAFAEIARSGEVPEVIAAFPEFGSLLQEARDKYMMFVGSCTADYERLKGIEAQKDFALEALKTPYSACLFQMRKGKDLREFARSVPIDTLMSWAGM
jgi:hypothetical protein